MTRIDAKNGRWYECPSGGTYPSVTNVLRVISKGPQFDRWLGNADSYDAAIATRDAAGNRGTMVHDAIEQLLTGTLSVPVAGWEPKAVKQLHGFTNWYQEVQPEVLDVEKFVFNDLYQYAGTADIVCKIGGKTWLIDVKTSGDIYPTYWMQLEAYAQAYHPHVDEVGVLLLKDSTKKGWMLKAGTDREFTFQCFISALNIFHYLYGTEPILRTPKDIPTEVSL